MRLLLLALLFAAPLAAQTITLVPYGGPLGGSVDGLEVTSTGTIVMLQDERLFVSGDGGDTWTPRLEELRFWVLEAMPNDTLVARRAGGDVYVSADGVDWHVHRNPNSRALRALVTNQGWLTFDNAGVWRSVDTGLNWQPIVDGIHEDERPVALSVTPSGEVVLTTSFRSYPSNGRGGFYFWDEAGWQRQTVDSSCANYLQIDAPQFATDNLAIAYSWGMDFSTLIHPPTYYEALVSTDGGATWRCDPMNVSAVGVRGGQLLRIIPGRERTLIEATGDGMAWDGLASLVGGDFDRLSVLPDGTLMAGSSRARLLEYSMTVGRGLYRVRPGHSPELMMPAQATSPIQALEAHGQALFAVTSVGAWQATPGGWTRVEARNLDPSAEHYGPLYDQAVALTYAPWNSLYFLGEPLPIYTKQGGSAGTALLAVGDSVLFRYTRYGTASRSVDRGHTWQGIPHPVSRFAEAGGIIAAGKSIWYSDDLGSTWHSTWTSDTLQTFALAVDDGAEASSHAYALVGRGWPNYTSAVLRSTGAPGPDMQWVSVSGSAAPQSFNYTWPALRLVVRHGVLFLATADWLYRSVDEGVTWETIYQWHAHDYSFWYPPESWTLPFAFDADGYLVVASEDGGLLRTTEPVIVSRDEPALPTGSKLAVAPNPAGGIVQIRPGAAEGRVEIFDLLGRRVARVAEGRLAETVSWDASALPAGLYFVRLTTPSGTQSSPLVVVR